MPPENLRFLLCTGVTRCATHEIFLCSGYAEPIKSEIPFPIEPLQKHPMTSAETLQRNSCDSANPVITVVILAYNHEHFIEEAVRSVLAQNVSVPVEILVGEDFSSDHTREVLTTLDRKYPGRLTLRLRDRNLGLSANLQDCRQHARGRYLAILEGDDFWNDPLKLQKQFLAMESHPDWSMCFHACRVFRDDGGRAPYTSPANPPESPLSLSDLLIENRVPTMSVTMFRQGVVTRTPDWHAQLRNGDWALYVLHADHGPVGFLPDVMTNYRVHSGGFWSGWTSFDRWQQTLLLFDCLEQHFEGRYLNEIRQTRNSHIAQLRQRVADLEKIERRYHSLRLDRIAAFGKWIRELLRKPKGPGQSN